MDITEITSREGWLSKLDERFGEASAEGNFPPPIPEDAPILSPQEYERTLRESGDTMFSEWREFVDFVLSVSGFYVASDTEPSERQKIRELFASNEMLNCLLVSVLDEQKWLIRSVEDEPLFVRLLGLLGIHDGAEGQYVDQQAVELFRAAVDGGIDLESAVRSTSDVASEKTGAELLKLFENFQAE